MGTPSRTGGVAEGSGFVLVQVGIAEVTGGCRQQILVVLIFAGHGFRTQRNHDHAVEVQPVLEFVEQREKDVIDDKKAIFGMLCNVPEIVRRQSEVQGVQHAPLCRNAQISFQVGVVIPHQGADPIAALQAGLLQGLCQGSRPAIDVSVGVAMQRAIRQARQDLNFGKQLSRPLQEMRERERIVHHGA